MYRNWLMLSTNNYRYQSLYRLSLCHFIINTSYKIPTIFLNYHTCSLTDFYTNFDFSMPIADFYRFYCLYNLVCTRITTSFLSYPKCPCRSIVHSPNPCNFSHNYLSKKYFYNDYYYRDSDNDGYVSDSYYDGFYSSVISDYHYQSYLDIFDSDLDPCINIYPRYNFKFGYYS